MSIREIVVCKFAGCNQVYTDPRFLPCGKRTCAAHIESMLVKRDDELDHDRKIIKCHFCEEIHIFPDNSKGFPADENIPMLLRVKYCAEHDAAKKSFNDVSSLLQELTKLDREDYVIDYFKKVESDIFQDKEINLQKLLAYYQKLVDDVHERKIKCLENLKTNKQLEIELAAIKQTLDEYDVKVKKENVDFILKTLDGDEAKGIEIQSECNAMFEKMRPLGEQLKEKLFGDLKIHFVASSMSTQIANICGNLVTGTIDSTIVSSDSMKNDLINLCKLSGKQLKLLYRASRDGFQASSFHAKCNSQPSTLTIIKTTGGDIFGGYAAFSWDTNKLTKADPKAFIFSLVNAYSTPRSFPAKVGCQDSIYCARHYGPTFGGGHDFFISDNSNTTKASSSHLGQSYDFAQETNSEARSFLTGSSNFQTVEVEVFQVICKVK